MTVKTIEDLIEPDSENEKKFNLSIKQLNFIQNDNNIKFMNNIIKLMKQYKLETQDINNIVEKHIQNEFKKQEKNEARRLKKQQEKKIIMIVIVKMILKAFYQIKVVIKAIEEVKKEVIKKDSCFELE